jgi:hypothetical protein
MPFSSLAFMGRLSSIHVVAQACLVAALACGGWIGTGSVQDARAQAADSLCIDTPAAEDAYRNRDYQEAVSLASQCTDRSIQDAAAIRAYRVITLASLRQGALLQARSAVESILQIDPTYTADPVNDPPFYDLFVSMVRRKVDPETTAEAEGDTTEQADPETTEPTPTQARPEPIESGLFLKLGGGIADYTGDLPVQNVGHPFDFQEFKRGSGLPFLGTLELGYQVSARWAVLLGVQAGNYPIVGFAGKRGNEDDSDRYTPQLLVRYTFRAPDRTVRPYIDVGGNVTLGGEPVVGTGFGPSLGGGVNIALGRTLSFYVESRFNVTLPDDGIDDAEFSSAGVGGPVDSVNQLLGIGLRIQFGGP